MKPASLRFLNASAPRSPGDHVGRLGRDDVASVRELDFDQARDGLTCASGIVAAVNMVRAQ